MTGEAIGPVLQAKGLHAHQGRAHVLRGVDLSIYEGDGVALTGANRAGKSTLLRTLVGLVMPSAGEVLFRGQQIEGRPANEIARLGIGFVPKQRRVFARMTAYENLEIGRRLEAPQRSKVEWTFDKVFHLFPRLAARKDRFAGDLSPGEQRLLIIARTLMGSPEVVLLDEPAHDLPADDVDELIRVLDRMRGEGLSLVVAETSLRVAAAVCDRVCVMEDGKILQQQALEPIEEDEDEPVGAKQKVATAGHS
ncbi:ABC transporter ATP-binding protein [Rhodoligotrophos defluvii]|uniref:ABC transporter ATP-binding protein n=1 Tax=Rhodoligotrophos defluvii TaxID=2561934 RepID=UPI0010C99D83|nr:ATP-binding cassette domain-containing protein [Rhodoligotrophos defluvii]